MLRYSLIHPMPSWDLFHISSHKYIGDALNKLHRLQIRSQKHPEKFEKWFDYRKIMIRDNDAAGKIVFRVGDESNELTKTFRG